MVDPQASKVAAWEQDGNLDMKYRSNKKQTIGVERDVAALESRPAHQDVITKKKLKNA